MNIWPHLLFWHNFFSSISILSSYANANAIKTEHISKVVALRLLPFSDAHTKCMKRTRGKYGKFITNRLLCQWIDATLRCVCVCVYSRCVLCWRSGLSEVRLKFRFYVWIGMILLNELLFMTLGFMLAERRYTIEFPRRKKTQRIECKILPLIWWVRIDFDYRIGSCHGKSINSNFNGSILIFSKLPSIWILLFTVLLHLHIVQIDLTPSFQFLPFLNGRRLMFRINFRFRFNFGRTMCAATVSWLILIYRKKTTNTSVLTLIT